MRRCEATARRDRWLTTEEVTPKKLITAGMESILCVKPKLARQQRPDSMRCERPLCLWLDASLSISSRFLRLVRLFSLQSLAQGKMWFMLFCCKCLKHCFHVVNVIIDWMKLCYVVLNLVVEGSVLLAILNGQNWLKWLVPDTNRVDRVNKHIRMYLFPLTWFNWPSSITTDGSFSRPFQKKSRRYDQLRLETLNFSFMG